MIFSHILTCISVLLSDATSIQVPLMIEIWGTPVCQGLKIAEIIMHVLFLFFLISLNYKFYMLDLYE